VPKARTIAIDGPASSGKTTIGSALARRLGYAFLDTGMVYRAATLGALLAGVSIHDEEALVELLDRLRIEVRPAAVDDGRASTVLLNGEDVTWALRDKAVDDSVSPVSAHPRVRQRLLEVQRSVAAQGPVVMVGRDIGTVVLPEADLKIYLDASPEERARRRYRELLNRGVGADYDEVLHNVLERDSIDSGRAAAPLAQAPDAVYLDTTGMDIAEVLAVVEGLTCGCRN